MTDNNGRKADFRNVILIMTTNAGAETLNRPSIGFANSRVVGDEMAEIRRMFTPEFRNRLDAIIPFAALDREIILRVVDKFLMQLEDQLHERRRGRVHHAPARAPGQGRLRSAHGRAAHAPHQDTIRALADELLFGKLVDGGSVTVDLDESGKVAGFRGQRQAAVLGRARQAEVELVD